MRYRTIAVRVRVKFVAKRPVRMDSKTGGEAAEPHYISLSKKGNDVCGGNSVALPNRIFSLESDCS